VLRWRTLDSCHVAMKLLLPLCCAALLSACAVAPDVRQDGTAAANDVPEYATGSIIAKKNKPRADGVQSTTSTAALEEIRQNSSSSTR